MGLSAFTDDFNGTPLGAGYLQMSTSAGNQLVFRDPASMNAYYQSVNGPANGSAQLQNAGNNNNGGFNNEIGLASS